MELIVIDSNIVFSSLRSKDSKLFALWNLTQI